MGQGQEKNGCGDGRMAFHFASRRHNHWKSRLCSQTPPMLQKTSNQVASKDELKSGIKGA
jgi:hypothetical protein